MKNKWVAGLLSMGIVTATVQPYAASAEAPVKWSNVNQYEEAEGSLFNSEHYDFVKYSKIGAMLQQYAKESNRVSLKTNGVSADGYPMYVVTVSNPADKGKFGHYKKLRKQMFKNPQKAQDWIAQNPDFKVPVMINGSIHGTEYVGSDAVLQMIERFAYENDKETMDILGSNILIFNVVANPDGRVDGTRFNGEGIDLNRDFITQSQPETKATVELIKEWNPMVFLDLHGYVKGSDGKTGLIEPCTPPHNPNYEYDLFSKWALNQAEAMESQIIGNSAAYKGPEYEGMTSTYIPQRDDSSGWDDYPPIFTPMYAMYHGAYGYTLEAPTNDLDGVQWTKDAVLGAVKYATANKQGMLRDQIEIFKRGINFDHPYHKEGFFPKAYVLPVDEQDPTVTEKAVNHLIFNDLKVEKATKAFSANGKTYPAGTFIVPMDQAKAGLANTMLWNGEDITNDTPAMYDISAWSLPELWGFDAVEVTENFSVKSAPVQNADFNGALSGKGPFVIPNKSVAAVKLVNDLVNSGETVYKGSDGSFYVTSFKNGASSQLVKDAGIQLKAASLPAQKESVKDLKVAILKDGGISKAQSHAGTKLALARLGYDVTEVTPRDVAAKGLSDFDAFVFSGTDTMITVATSSTRAGNKEFILESEAQYNQFKANVQDFVNKGGKYLAVGAGGSRASAKLGVTDVKVNTGGSDSNGIVNVNYGASEITSGYKSTDVGFVYRPVWYTDLGDATSLATFGSGDFFVAGHWQNNSIAAGQPVIVKEGKGDVTLIGLEAGFRDHTDYLFRLMSNTLFE
ncbi:M14 family zinc carboxypeptidase [Fictibacillus iocasae]|uniref:M14 family zinc carboxypeptidase n=1 Tax=Fictibacillus iocasae TaxID=2715437 RepID=A0ABW2NM17_9BACL